MVRLRMFVILALLAVYPSGRAVAEPFCTGTADPAAGVLRENGSPATRRLEDAVIGAFRRREPALAVRNREAGTSASPPLLAFNAIDLGVMGRRITSPELEAVRHASGRQLLEIRLARTPPAGGADVAWSLAVYVAQDNPLHDITLDQLGRILATGAAGGDLAVWGQIGAALAHDERWRDQPIHPYGSPEHSGFGTAVQSLFGDRPLSPATVTLKDSAAILRRMKGDSYGIAVAALGPAPAGLRQLPIRNEAGATVTGTASEIAAGAYPLSRFVYLYAVVPRNKADRSAVCSFVRFVLSPAGQQAIAESGAGYVPLPASDLVVEQRKVD